MMNKTVLITGATSGIGKACAEKFAKSGAQLILLGRRTDRLGALSVALKSKYNTSCLCITLDVRDRDEVFRVISQLPDEWKKIDILINNAGLALGKENFEESDIDDWDTMLHTNVDGLLYVSRAVLPYMIQQQSGHIINMSSIAGSQVYQGGSVYCASKFAVNAITQGMRIDLMKYHIKVTSICPGVVETEFSLVRFKGDKKKADEVYKGFKPLVGEDIAETVFFCTQLPDHVCINELSVTPVQQASAYYYDKNQS